MITIGIVGMGSIGKRHYDNFKELGCTVTGYDPYSAMWQGGLVKDCLQDCDGIVIASPSITHAEYIHWFNNKPLLIEKPVVMTEGELAGLSKVTNVKMVGYNLRFHSCVKIAKEWMGQGLVGKPIWARFICAQYNDRPAYRRDGVVLNWSHEIDLALHLLGPAEVKNSIIENRANIHLDYKDEAYANINLSHKNGCHTNIHLDYLTQPERRGFTIVCEGGSITADLVTRQIYVQRSDGAIIQRCAFKDTFDSNYKDEAVTFLSILCGDKVSKRYCTMAEAMDVVRICLDAKELASV